MDHQGEGHNKGDANNNLDAILKMWMMRERKVIQAKNQKSHKSLSSFSCLSILAPVEDVDESEISNSSQEHWHRSIVQGGTEACAPVE